MLILRTSSCAGSAVWRGSTSRPALADADTGKVRYFEGTPIPTSILIVCLLGIAMWLGRTDSALPFGVVRLGPALLHPLALVFALSGSAMISATLASRNPDGACQPRSDRRRLSASV